ncbi:acyl carrier protein [Virgisporangium aurantiacum]|uniref:Actinorhodin polyketide synthase acyl carrier protein n=1 Tax=Virgisporangium aurantiacum TaxID=175570 RepID=A0A8J3ZCQ5_9ACTN|nr:acyl carrier protein [Virgisporangium aurantiacum]GIJ60423.1 actinorhodin polyketide synthase acyl carrier protein [Virgisporangium aurantiacum]
MEQVTLDDVKQIMRECAGEDESIDLDGDVADLPFAELGYDSLALMETASRTERRFGVAIPEDDLAEVSTLNGFVALVNRRLAGVG